MAKTICLFLSAILLSSSPVLTQQASLRDPTVSNGGVRLVVIVLDSSGHPVTDLREQDFTVFDDELIRPIRVFATVNENENKRSPALRAVEMRSATQSSTANVPRYEITFDAALASELKEYHRVAVKVDRPDLRIITSQGYYAAR
jgi:hypothetical protein